MQIILMEKVVNLGGLGDVVKVKDGYARNFLIPQGKAKRATEANKKFFEEKRAELEKAAAEKLAAAQAQAEKLDGLMVQITRKAGVDGRPNTSLGEEVRAGIEREVSGRDAVEDAAGAGEEIRCAGVRGAAGRRKDFRSCAACVASVRIGFVPKSAKHAGSVGNRKFRK